MQLFVPDLFDGQTAKRPAGFFGNPSLLAGYLLFHWFFTGWLAVRKFGAGQRLLGLLYSCAAVPILVAIFFTETRGALAGLLSGMVSLTVWAIRGGSAVPVRGRLTLRSLAGATLLGLVLIVGTFAATRSAPFWKQIPGVSRMTEVTLSSVDVVGRWEPLKLCFEALSEHPLLGVGYENFRSVFDAHYHRKRFGDGAELDKPHNIVGEYLVTTGVLGLLSYLAFLLTLGVALVRSKLAGFGPFGLAACVAYFVQNLVLFDTLGPLLALSLLTACADAHAPDTADTADTQVRASEHATTVLALLAGLLAVVGVAANYSILRANRGQRWARGHLQYHNPDRAYASYVEARRTWFNPYRVSVHQGFVQALHQAHFQGVSLGPERTRRVLNDFRRSLDEEPGDYLARLAYSHALGVLDAQTPERLAEAARYLQEAAAISPGRPAIYQGLSGVRILQHNWPEALAVGEKLLRLTPESGDAHFAHGLVAFEARDAARGLRSIETAARLGRTPRDGEEMRVVANRYAEAGNYPRAVALYKQALDLNADDMEARWKLGVTYFHAGDHDAAREALQTVATAVDVRTALPYDSLKPVFDALGLMLP